MAGRNSKGLNGIAKWEFRDMSIVAMQEYTLNAKNTILMAFAYNSVTKETTSLTLTHVDANEVTFLLNWNIPNAEIKILTE